MRFIATAQEKFAGTAERELLGADPHGQVVQRFPDGVFLFESSFDRPGFLGALRAHPPVFARHVQPVETETTLPSGDSAPAEISRSCADLFDESIRGLRVAVQVRQTPGEKRFSDYAVKERLDPLISAAGAEPAVQDPDRIVSVFIVRNPGTVYCGLSAPSENLNPWSGGVVRFFKDPNSVSRAESKLLEAMKLGFLSVRDGQRALDLGAAPGGWTRVLQGKGCSVTAVDPAELDRAVSNLDQVTHVRCDANQFRPQGSFDLITDDMNWEAFRSAKVLKRLTVSLQPRGSFLMTIKLGSEDPAQLLPKITRLLEPGLTVTGIRQLYHNRGEVTAWGLRPCQVIT
ncbi:MAG: hypothetical protein A2X36_15180 [Elusimicrobia bacterium GWA2_69_24]|nr:MAG: hypothetical protein A2X36_15180 [Elusimicrobia bacterium GWA2_69_24]HBL15984.1 hypothetical protein [Elusimicrobiota bacterium]